MSREVEDVQDVQGFQDAVPEEPLRSLLVNLQDQPMELHLSGRVAVVPARGELEVGEDELGAPQVEVLRRQRRLSVRRAGGPNAPAAAPRKSNEDEPPREA